MSARVASLVDDAIANNAVFVASKSYCPYCKATKELLNKLNADAKILELDEMDEGSDIQAYLQDKTGQRTVPNVFIKGKHIGGNSDLQALNSSGELKKLLGGKL